MLPQSAIANIEIQQDQPSLTWGIDFEKGEVTGMIDDIDAIKQTIFLILNSERFRHEIYSWDYGVELQDLIGQQPSYAYLEIERLIKEALMMDGRITGVSDFQFTRNKNDVTVRFTVKTSIGEIEAERTVAL